MTKLELFIMDIHDLFENLCLRKRKKRNARKQRVRPGEICYNHS